MGQQPERSDHEAPDEVRIEAAPVGARLRSGAIPLLPRTLGVALVVGFIAFAVGVQLAPRQPGPIVTLPTPAPSTSPASPAPTAAADPTAPIGRSRFASTLDLNSLVREAGLTTCSGSDSGGSGNDRAYVVLVSRCSVPPARQQATVRRLEALISTAIREAAVSREGGVAGPDDADGPAVVGWNYRSDGFDGSIYLVATHTGTNFQVLLVLSEQRPG